MRCLGRLGHIGDARETLEEALSNVFSGWEFRWRIGEKTYPASFAHALYENAYVSYFRRNPGVLNELVAVARDVYDISPADVSAKEVYSRQSGAHHIQDIAIRRAVHRLGKEFEGDDLVQIRSPRKPWGFLNPGKVPFHKQEIIMRPALKGWWDEGSIEDFYQSNRFLYVFLDR